MRSMFIVATAATWIAASALAQTPNATTAPGNPPARSIEGTPGTPPAGTPALNNPRTTNSAGGSNASTANRPATTAGPAAADGPSNPAVKTSEGNNAATPVAGANSFTEGQAKARIESRGYTNVSSLTKDNRGVWRGKAMKDGKQVNVSLDFQGNVVAD
jgi:hypothetical protein